MQANKSPDPSSPFTLPSMDSEPELRTAQRLPAAVVPAITGVRISPHGAEASLINISETGLLAECSERLQPGSSVTVVFDGTFSPSSIPGRIARAAVAAVGENGRLRYHLGIAFNARIDLDAHKKADSPKTVVQMPAPDTKAPAPAMVLRNRW